MDFDRPIVESNKQPKKKGPSNLVFRLKAYKLSAAGEDFGIESS